jgi:hypothetical protein
MSFFANTKRSKWINEIFIKISPAEPESHHLKVEAIDILVFDVNDDGNINGKDVDVVYKILDTEIVKDNGVLVITKIRVFYQNRWFISIVGDLDQGGRDNDF